MSTDLHQITLRLPRSLHRKLSEVADDNGRSVNAEVIQRLAASFERDAAKEAAWEASYDQNLKDIEEAVKQEVGQIMESKVAELHERIAAMEAKLEAKVGKEQ